MKTILQNSIKTRLKTPAALVLALSALFSAQLIAQTHVIHAGEVLTIPGQAPLSKQTIVVTDGVITSLKSGFIPAKKIVKNCACLIH